MLASVISASAAIIGVLMGVFSTHILHYIDRKSEERKIINESIHYLLEVFHLVNRLNVEKMTAVYLDHYFQKVKSLFMELNENIVESLREQYCAMIRNTIIPQIQKQTFDDLNKLSDKYENMVAKLATILPINAYHLRDKNNLEELLKMVSHYFENMKMINIENGGVVKETVNQMQPSLTMDIVDEYKSDLKWELFALLKKTTWYNRCAGKKAIKRIESSVVSENDKRKIDIVIDGVKNQINQISKMGIV